MKTGILSMQRIPNYGSFLQAYGLRSLLEAQGCDVVFVDYKSGNPVVPYSRANALLFDIKRVLPIETVLDRIQHDILKKDNFRFEYRLNYLKKLGVTSHYRYHEKIDAAVIGSDEVFNCLQDWKRVGFSPMLFGQDLTTDHVISYAASFGDTTVERLKQYGVAEKVASWLDSFSALSVRDRNSYETVVKLTGREPSIHLDPVLVSDFDLPAVTAPFERYAVLYTYGRRPYSDEEAEAILQFCQRNDLELVSFVDAKPWVPHKIKADPFEMLAYMKNAAFIITDTFHGTVFSLKYNKNFVTRLRENNSEKLSDLLERTGQESRRIRDFTNLQPYYEDPPVFDKTNEIVKAEAKRTKNYLKENLK